MVNTKWKFKQLLMEAGHDAVFKTRCLLKIDNVDNILISCNEGSWIWILGPTLLVIQW